MDIIKDFVRPVLRLAVGVPVRLWYGARQIAAITAETASDIYAEAQHEIALSRQKPGA